MAVLADDFSQFVSDTQASSAYLAFARDNHGGQGYSIDNPKTGSELQKWVVFRDQVLRGTRPVPPTMTTAIGKGLVDAGVLYLDATAPAVDPPPPPPTSGVWAWDASEQAVDPQSAARMAAFSSYALHSGGGPFLMADIAVKDAPASTPTVDVVQLSGSKPGSIVKVPMPSSVRASGTNDHALSILLDNGVEWDLSSSEIVGGKITKSYVAWRNTGDVLATGPNGENATAAGFPYRPGLVTPAEIKAGRIDHALHFVIPNVGGGSTVYPAKQYAANYGSNTGLLLGSWIRLDPAADISNLSGWQHTVAVALQQYGAFLRDIGSSFHICATDQVNQGGNAADWGAAGVQMTSTNLNSQPYVAGFSAAFPWSRLQLLTPPAHS